MKTGSFCFWRTQFGKREEFGNSIGDVSILWQCYNIRCMDTEMIVGFLWKEFELRQQHYWETFDRLGLTIVAINIVPYIKPDIRELLGKLVLVFPISSFALSLFSSWLLGAEYQRLRMVYKKYEELLGEEIPRMPLNSWWQRLFAKPIGLKIAIFFGIGLSSFSLASAFVLWIYLIK